MQLSASIVMQCADLTEYNNLVNKLQTATNLQITNVVYDQGNLKVTASLNETIDVSTV